ncbi:hypothetical protein MMC18_004466 [Xylographa bjoerkii]|nr:hypothetical protein [Xylographa bjoerkii]
MAPLERSLKAFLAEAKQSQWQYLLDGGSIRTVVEGEKMRIDFQGMVTNKTPNLFNLQLQPNEGKGNKKVQGVKTHGRPSASGGSTCSKSSSTFATILVEKGAKLPTIDEWETYWTAATIPQDDTGKTNKALLDANNVFTCPYFD